jgi:hypothetical protein
LAWYVPAVLEVNFTLHCPADEVVHDVAEAVTTGEDSEKFATELGTTLL